MSLDTTAPDLTGGKDGDGDESKKLIDTLINFAPFILGFLAVAGLMSGGLIVPLLLGVAALGMAGANGQLGDQIQALLKDPMGLASALTGNEQAIETILKDRTRMREIMGDKVPFAAEITASEAVWDEVRGEMMQAVARNIPGAESPALKLRSIALSSVTGGDGLARLATMLRTDPTFIRNILTSDKIPDATRQGIIGKALQSSGLPPALLELLSTQSRAGYERMFARMDTLGLDFKALLEGKMDKFFTEESILKMAADQEVFGPMINGMLENTIAAPTDGTGASLSTAGPEAQAIMGAVVNIMADKTKFQTLLSGNPELVNNMLALAVRSLKSPTGDSKIPVAIRDDLFTKALPNMIATLEPTVIIDAFRKADIPVNPATLGGAIAWLKADNNKNADVLGAILASHASGGPSTEAFRLMTTMDWSQQGAGKALEFILTNETIKGRIFSDEALKSLPAPLKAAVQTLGADIAQVDTAALAREFARISQSGQPLEKMQMEFFTSMVRALPSDTLGKVMNGDLLRTLMTNRDYSVSLFDRVPIPALRDRLKSSQMEKILLSLDTSVYADLAATIKDKIADNPSATIADLGLDIVRALPAEVRSQIINGEVLTKIMFTDGNQLNTKDLTEVLKLMDVGETQIPQILTTLQANLPALQQLERDGAMAAVASMVSGIITNTELRVSEIAQPTAVARVVLEEVSKPNNLAQLPAYFNLIPITSVRDKLRTMWDEGKFEITRYDAAKGDPAQYVPYNMKEVLEGAVLPLIDEKMKILEDPRANFDPLKMVDPTSIERLVIDQYFKDNPPPPMQVVHAGFVPPAPLTGADLEAAKAMSLRIATDSKIAEMRALRERAMRGDADAEKAYRAFMSPAGSLATQEHLDDFKLAIQSEMAELAMSSIPAELRKEMLTGKMVVEALGKPGEIEKLLNMVGSAAGIDPKEAKALAEFLAKNKDELKALLGDGVEAGRAWEIVAGHIRDGDIAGLIRNLQMVEAGRSPSTWNFLRYGIHGNPDLTELGEIMVARLTAVKDSIHDPAWAALKSFDVSMLEGVKDFAPLAELLKQGLATIEENKSGLGWLRTGKSWRASSETTLKSDTAQYMSAEALGTHGVIASMGTGNEEPLIKAPLIPQEFKVQTVGVGDLGV